MPTRLQSGHGEYPDFEDHLSLANEQRNVFLLNYHNICHKMNNMTIIINHKNIMGTADDNALFVKVKKKITINFRKF